MSCGILIFLPLVTVAGASGSGSGQGNVNTCRGDGTNSCDCTVTRAEMSNLGVTLGRDVVFDAEGKCKTCHHTFGSHPSGTPAVAAPGKSLFSFLVCLPAPCLFLLPNCISSSSLLL